MTINIMLTLHKETGHPRVAGASALATRLFWKHSSEGRSKTASPTPSRISSSQRPSPKITRTPFEKPRASSIRSNTPSR